jgi:Uma2 family endonuclease
MTTTNIQAGTRMTLEEFLALPEMDQPCELIDGVVYMAARPIPDHQFLATILSSILVQQIVEIGLGIVLYEPGVVLSSNTAVAPDITVIRSDRTGIIGPTVIDGAPDIVAEVLSSNRNHDLVTKRRHYEARGIPEYWIIDAVADTLTVLELADGVYSERAVLTAEDTLTTPLFPDFDLPLAQLFNHPARLWR